mgnify:CR=1 FL=1
MEREPARRYRAVGEGVFSSALRKFKSPILGWDGSVRFLFLFLKRKFGTLLFSFFDFEENYC